MAFEPIVKLPWDGKVAPNMGDYEHVRAMFNWEQARRDPDGLPEGRGLNIAHEAIDRHASGPNANRVALRLLAKSGASRDLTFEDLRGLTNRFANVLQSLVVPFVCRSHPVQS